MILLALVACPAPDANPSPAGDSASVVDDTGTTSAPTGAWGTLLGAPADALGNAVQAAGDLDVDGDGDVLVAAYLGNRVCAVFGPVPAGRSAIDDLEPACFVGETDLDYAGYGMAAVGDTTGDGVADIVVGSVGNADVGANSGKAYLVAGPLVPGSWSVGDAAYTTWVGETASDYAGIAASAAGDVTGDGNPDLLIGASGFDGAGGGGGRAYLLAGPVVPGAFALAAAYASVTGLGVADTGTPPPHGAFGTGDFIGESLAGRGDFDGDGVDDLALGASGDQTLGPNTGKVVVFRGPVAAGAWLVIDADLTLWGPAAESYAGSPTLAVPDLTGDGLSDLLLAADGLGAGVVYAVGAEGSGSAELVDAGIRFEGEADDDLFGYSLATPTDLDGDAALDLVIGAPGSDRAAFEAGAVWVFSGPFAAGVYTAAQGAVVTGEVQGDTFGAAVDVAGDLNGDTGPDLVIGARNSDSNGGFSGAVYLVGG